MMCKLPLLGLVLVVFFASSYAIFLGQDAVIEDYPFVASLQIEYFGHNCGAIILSPRWVMTTGICAGRWNYTLYTPRISAGSTSLSDDGAQNNQTIFIASYVTHPEFQWGALDPYNIGLVRLAKPLVFGPTVQPATFAPPDTVIGPEATFVGWGETNETNWTPSTVLQSISLPVINRTECETTLEEDDLEFFLCTGPVPDEVGPCFKDKGGPLVQDGQVLGMYVYAQRCAQNPSAYLQFGNLTEWIQETIKDE